MINNFTPDKTKLIKTFYEEAFRAFERDGAKREIDVRFYPYIGINHTIRLRGGKIFVRLAEICETAPLEIQRALAFILVAKLLRKKVPPLASDVYRSYIKTHEMQAKAQENKREKGRKIVSTPQGEVYDLEEMFDRLNRIYFRNSLEKPTLSWSAKQTYRILGHHDATHQTIIVSKSLDDAKVPKYVVEFVVFHEMLHIFHPTTHRNGRRYNHTTQFRRNEKKFADYDAAENWIEENAAKLKRRVKRQKKK